MSKDLNVGDSVRMQANDGIIKNGHIVEVDHCFAVVIYEDGTNDVINI